MWFRCIGFRCNPQRLHRLLVLPLVFLFSQNRAYPTFFLGSGNFSVRNNNVSKSSKPLSACGDEFLGTLMLMDICSCFPCRHREPLALYRWGQSSGRFDEALYSVLEGKELFVPGSRNHNFKFISRNNNKSLAVSNEIIYKIVKCNFIRWKVKQTVISV